MTPVLTAHRPPPVHELRRTLGPLALLAIAGVLFALLVGWVEPPSTLDRITVVNRSAEQVEVGLAADGEPGVLWIAAVEPGATAVVNDVLDTDDGWVVRGEHAGRRLGEVHVSRAQLARNGWRVVLPADWGGSPGA